MGRTDLLLGILNRSESPYVRAITIGSMGKLGLDTMRKMDIDLVRLENTVWKFLINNTATVYEKLKASEALVALDLESGIDFDDCIALIEKEAEPYLVKNYVILLSKIDRARARTYLVKYMQRCKSTVVMDAIQMLLHREYTPIFDLPEPDMLFEHYSSSYPSTESDITITESSDSWNLG